MKPSSPVAKNVAGLFSLQFVVKGLAAVWTFYLARRLGVASYGLWANVMSLIAIFGTIQGLGILGVVVKDVSQDHERTNSYFGASIVVYLSTSILVLVLAVVSSLFLGYDAGKTSLVAVSAFSFVVMAPGLASQAILHGHEEFILHSLIYCLGMLVYMLLGVVLVEAGMGVLGVFLALCAGYAAMSGILVVKTVKMYSRPIFEGVWERVKYLSRLGFPLVLSGALTEVMLRADRILINKFWGEASVGYYHAAFNLVYLPREIFFIPLITAVYTRLSAYYGGDRPSFEKLFERVNIGLLLIALPAAVTFSVFSREITGVFYGVKYSESAGILPILSWMLPPLFILTFWQQLWILQNKTSMIFYTNIFGTILSLALNFFLLPKIGFVAAAITAVFTQALMMAAAVWLLKDERLFHFTARLPRIFLTVAALWIFFIFLRPFAAQSRVALLAVTSSGAVFYLFCVRAFRAISVEEVEWMSKQLDWLKLRFQSTFE